MLEELLLEERRLRRAIDAAEGAALEIGSQAKRSRNPETYNEQVQAAWQQVATLKAELRRIVQKLDEIRG